MESSDNAATWLQFFKSAGIPTTTAANYAILFTTHRIQIDMLNDLSRDILQAMGITVMGDIIAILKHAKEIHAQNTREKTLGCDPCNSPLRSKPSTAVVATARQPIVPSRSSLVPLTAGRIVSTSASTATPSPVQKKIASPINGVNQKKRQIISLKARQVEEVPTVKNRRVLPEHEGMYKVKMPLGSTAKTRRLLAQQGILSPVLPLKKSSVFERLGDCNVSSTTETESGQITFTDFGRKFTNTPSSLNASVFARLGPGVDVSSTSDGPQKNTGKFIINKNTEVTRTVLNTQAKNVKQLSVMNRLGPRVDTNVAANNEIRVRKKIVLKQPVKTQGTTEGILGGGEKRKISDSVQDRLGVPKAKKKLTTVSKSELKAKLAMGHKIEIVTKTDSSGQLKRIKVLKKVNKNADVFQRLGSSDM